MRGACSESNRAGSVFLPILCRRVAALVAGGFNYKCVKEQRDCERRVSGQFSKELASLIKINLLGKKLKLNYPLIMKTLIFTVVITSEY